MAELTDIILDGIPVAEMEAGTEDYVILDPKTVNEIKESLGDDNPQFPVLCIESGVSANKFEWTPEILESAAKQINENQPVGYLGHIKPEDDRWVLPPPQTWWIKAVTKKEGDKTKLYVKGYNLPDEPIRRYIKAKVINSASWHGKASVQHMKGGIQRVKDFALESIDWSRKGKSAMSARLVTVAAEMEGKEDDKVSEVTKLTADELKEQNPSLVKLIEKDATAEADDKLTKMEEQVKEAEDAKSQFAKLREALGIDEKADVLEAVVQMVKKLDEIGRKNVTERLGEILKEKVKDDDARAVITRLMPVSEMEDLDDEALKTKVNETIDKDESIKLMVNRFAGTAPPPKNRDISEMRGNNGDRYKDGSKTGSIRVTRTKL